MEKFIPYEKLSKKEKRKLDAAKRGSWGGLDPVTRKPPNPRAYKRNKAWKWEKEPPSVPCLLLPTLRVYPDSRRKIKRSAEFSPAGSEAGPI